MATPAASRASASPVATVSRSRPCIGAPPSEELVHLYRFFVKGVNGEQTVASSGAEPAAAGGPAAGDYRAAGRDRGQIGDAPGGRPAGGCPAGFDDLLLRVRPPADRGSPQTARGRARRRVAGDGGDGARSHRGQRPGHRRTVGRSAGLGPRPAPRRPVPAVSGGGPQPGTPTGGRRGAGRLRGPGGERARRAGGAGSRRRRSGVRGPPRRIRPPPPGPTRRAGAGGRRPVRRHAGPFPRTGHGRRRPRRPPRPPAPPPRPAARPRRSFSGRRVITATCCTSPALSAPKRNLSRFSRAAPRSRYRAGG